MAERDYYTKEESPKLPEDFGFNYPHNIGDIRRMVTILKMFKMWPDGGGFLDQDVLLIEDIITYQRIENYTIDKHTPKKPGEYNYG